MTQSPQGPPPGPGHQVPAQGQAADQHYPPPYPPDTGYPAPAYPAPAYPPSPAFQPEPAYAPAGHAPDPGVPADGGYAPPEGAYVPTDQGYPPTPYPPDAYAAAPSAGYAEPLQPDVGYVEPQYLPPGYPPATPPQPRRGSPIIAPVLALLGLIIVGGLSVFGIDYIGRALDEGATAEADAAPAALAAIATSEPSEAPTEAPAVIATDAPAGVTPSPAAAVTAEPVGTLAPPEAIAGPVGESADIKGTILFSRNGGDLWQASGRELRNLTSTKSSRADSNPAWSGDGKQIYFVRRGQRTTNNARLGGKYTLYPTNLMRMRSDGSNSKVVYDSIIQDGRGLWFSHLLQPDVSPNGANVAVVSDGADGSGPVILHVVNSRSGRMRKVPAPSLGDLGHNDPDFSPDGTRIAYTYNANAGNKGAPRVGIFTCKSRANCSQGRNKLLKPGFANPSWSPDAKWLAVETTDGTGRDIAIIGARKGDLRARLTTGGNSFAPVVSPDGDQIAYLKRDGTDIDLRVMTLDVNARGFPTLLADQAVTTDGLVDGDSNPSWFIPKRQRANADVEIDPGDAADIAADESAEPSDGEDASEGAPPPPA